MLSNANAKQLLKTHIDKYANIDLSIFLRFKYYLVHPSVVKSLLQFQLMHKNISGGSLVAQNLLAPPPEISFWISQNDPFLN